MTYDIVAQNEHDDAASASGSDASGDSRAHHDPTSPQQSSPELENLGGSQDLQDAKTSGGPGGALGFAIRSLTSPSTTYDMVEDDDYDMPDPIQESPSSVYGSRKSITPESPAVQPRSITPEPIVPTPSTARSVDLRHPTPGLQSLQGAYVGNVERLEKSAETLSMGSDIGEELRKMKLEQDKQSPGSVVGAGDTFAMNDAMSASSSRKFSTSSLSNSIICVNSAARTGGYSPGGYMTSPKGSVVTSPTFAPRARSTSIASRLAQVPEPGHDGVDSIQPMSSQRVPILPPPKPPVHGVAAHEQPQPFVERGYDEHGHEALPDRPATSASTDTYQQVTTLFRDFDGVHFTPHTAETAPSRQVSLNQPPLARDPQPYQDARTDESMVFYPAPVPMMLNLPQKLSKRPPISHHEKRRTKVVSTIPEEARKSALWLSGDNTGLRDPRGDSANLGDLPPQLRASAFFEQAPQPLEIDVKQDSAVATLDSILDASAYAPVSAFTDHPIVGHVGSEVYGKAKKKRSSKFLDKKNRESTISVNLLGNRQSILFTGSRKTDPNHAELEDGERRHRDSDSESGDDEHHHPSHDHAHSGDEDGESSDEADGDDEGDRDGEGEDDYFGPPTTLLAELQLRKQEMKQRTRTAATAFPHGMHSTLLELDAVAQVQNSARRRGQVTLAWEDPEAAAGAAEDPEDDVPLGVLFPGNKDSLANQHRPLGLMEKREMEENEPLSKRRARLRGDPAPPAQGPGLEKRASTYTLAAPGATAHGPGLQKRASAYTLAAPGAASQDPGLEKRASMYTLTVPGLAEPDSGDEGETLAQRLKRLKGQDDKYPAIVTDEFANELLGQLGETLGDKKEEPKAAPPPEEETLGQRRKRLQEEAKAKGATLKQRYSMASILQAHPAAGAGKPSLEASMPPARPYQGGNVSSHRLSMAGPTMYQHASQSQPAIGRPVQPTYPSYGQAGYGNGYNAQATNGNLIGVNALNGFGFGAQRVHEASMMPPGPPINPMQRDMIDRWRQSVRE